MCAFDVSMSRPAQCQRSDRTIAPQALGGISPEGTMRVTTTAWQKKLSVSAESQVAPTRRLRRLLVISAAIATCIYGSLLGRAEASCTPSIIYSYDTAGRLNCVYNVCTAQGVNYTYDPDGDVQSITSATSCQQNTMRSLSAKKALASSRSLPGVTSRPARLSSKVGRVVAVAGEKQRNRTASPAGHNTKGKPLAVSLR